MKGFEFAKPHDGTQQEISQVERDLVSATFGTFVDDTLLHHIEDVDSRAILQDRPPRHSLFLRSNRGDDAQDSYATVTVNHSPGSKNAVKEISLQHIVDGLGRDRIAYRQQPDGLVVRWDGGDKYEKNRVDEEVGDVKELTGVESDEEALAVTSNNLAKARENMANIALEESMGVQNQPVGMDELEQVMDIVTTAEPRERV